MRRIATVPTIIDATQLGQQRYALVEAIVRLTESYRDDYLPGSTTWDAFALVLICQKMLAMHAVGREASASSLARSSGMPRTTVLRRLAQLKKIGAVEQHGRRYLMSSAYLNRPVALQGFKRRLAILRKTAEELSNLDISSSLRH
jgi:biotin operon repressor